MTKEEMIDTIKELEICETTIVNRIAEIGDDDLMTLFLDWQNLRLKLNTNFIEQLATKPETNE